MKVGSSGGVSGPGGAYSPSRPAAGGFSVASSGAASDAAPMARTAGPTGVSSLDALLALQEVGGPLERRRRAVRRWQHRTRAGTALAVTPPRLTLLH